MVNSDIENFISSGRERGLEIDEIKQQLLSQGNFDYDIDRIMEKMGLLKSREKQIDAPAKIEKSIENWDKQE